MRTTIAQTKTSLKTITFCYKGSYVLFIDSHKYCRSVDFLFKHLNGFYMGQGPGMLGDCGRSRLILNLGKRTKILN